MTLRTITLITGASSGLGKDFATEYAKAKQDLFLIARRIDRLQAIKAELEHLYGITVLVAQVDLADAKQLDEFIADWDKNLFIERLINNAGFGHHGPFETYPKDIQQDMIEVNVTALTRLCNFVIPMMKEQKRGEILNVASMAAFTPGPYMAQYYATKAYVLSLSMALHEELKPFGIKVSALCPGPTHTEFGQVASYKNDSGIQSAVSMESLPVVKMSIKALEKNRSVAVPGFSNKVLRVLMKLIPKRLSAKIIKNIQKQRF
jgi:short-subunit dehydrogenase